MNKSFTFLLLALGLLFHACTKQMEVQPNENTPIPNFWQYSSDESLLNTTITTLKNMGMSDSFEKYVSQFGKPLWDSSLTSLTPGEEIPSSIIIPIVHRYKQFTNAAILGAYVGDKFQYQVIYRYYMPKELIKTADDKNRWEGLFQAFDKQLFNRGLSSGFQRKEEKRSGKGNANARYIEIAVTYCSYSYVTNSEGVPLGPTTSSCNTQYIYQWIDDAPTYTPPTPTNPGSGTVPVYYPPTGSGGGTTTTAPPKDVYNMLTDPCLKAIVDALGKAKVDALTKQFYSIFGANGQTANVAFMENLTMAEPGGTLPVKISGNGHTYTILLNPNILANNATVGIFTSKEYIASVIFHEMVHAMYSEYQFVAQSTFKDHQQMFQNSIGTMRDALVSNYGMSQSDATALALGGIDDVLKRTSGKTQSFRTEYAEMAKTKYGIDLAAAEKVRLDYATMKNGKGSKCP